MTPFFGQAHWSSTLPTMSAGLEVYMQAFAVDLSDNAAGMFMSTAAHIVVGSR